MGTFLAGQYPGQCCSPQGHKAWGALGATPSSGLQSDASEFVKCDRRPGKRRGCRNGPAHQGGSHAARGCWGSHARAAPGPGPGLPLTRIWAPNHPLQLLSRPPTAAPVFWTLGRPVRGCSSLAGFSEYLASAPGEQAGVCHTAGAHRSQWQSLHGKEGDPGDAGAEGLRWRARCLRLWGHPAENSESRRSGALHPRRAPAKGAVLHTWTDVILAGMRLPCGWPPGLSPTDRACGCRSRIRQNQRACGSVLCPCWTADGIRASIEGEGEEREVFISQSCPSDSAAPENPPF